MAIHEIRLFGDPVLRRRAEPVGAVDDGTRRLMDEMLATMYAADGVGLAAPQIGLSRRIIVVDVHEPDVPAFGLVDPEILDFSEDTAKGEEGCLSMPGLRDIVERPAAVVVQGIDRDGSPRRIQAEGLLARVLQHEIDHLDGIMFFDRLSPLKRRMLLDRWQRMKPDEE